MKMETTQQTMQQINKYEEDRERCSWGEKNFNSLKMIQQNQNDGSQEVERRYSKI